MSKCAGDAFDEWERKFEVEKSDPEESLSDRGRGERKFSKFFVFLSLRSFSLGKLPPTSVNHVDDCNQMGKSN